MKTKIVLVSALLLGIFWGSFAQNKDFIDYDDWKEGVSQNIINYLKENGNFDISVENLNIENKVKTPLFPSVRKKRLSGVTLKEKCKYSSLLVCGFSGNLSAKNASNIWPIASATVLSADGVCVTNYHVLFNFILTGLVGDKPADNNMRFVADYSGKVYPIVEVLAADPVNDFAIFRVANKEQKLVPLPMKTDVKEGENIYCLAHPRGMPFCFTNGIVSRNVSFVNKENGHRKYESHITADFGVGASGGPIIDDCGNLIGIVGATFTMYADQQKKKNFQMSVKKAIPAFLIRDCFTVSLPKAIKREIPKLPEKVNSRDTATIGIHYRMTFLYNKQSDLYYTEERVVWASPKHSLDVGYVPLEKEKGKKYHITPTSFYYDTANKNLCETYRLLSSELLVANKINEVKWEIDTSDVKMLNGYFCQKGTCNFGGRKWTAWFTDELNVSVAPYNLTGLPGVIVEVQDADSEMRWEMLGVLTPPKTKNGLDIQISPYLTPVSDKELALIKKYFGRTPISYVKETFFGINGSIPPGILFPSVGIDACNVTNR